jgi:AcrR family transcriptional regulator
VATDQVPTTLVAAAPVETTAADGPSSRRDRQRTATEAEIKAVARRQLAELGPDGVSLRGIARDIGMTAPGLYRYFASLDDLLQALCADFFTDATDAVALAIRDAGEDVTDRMHAAIRGFRHWAVTHRAEFILMFRSPDGPDSHELGAEHSSRFTWLFLELFVGVWEQRALDLADGTPIPEAACRQMETFVRLHQIDLPRDAMWAFASSWVRLYAVICMEVLDQLGFMFDDVEPYFEAELASVARTIGLQYRPLPGA